MPDGESTTVFVDSRPTRVFGHAEVALITSRLRSLVRKMARLRRVGWLLLGVQALGVATMVVYGFLPKALHEVYLGFGPSPAGLLAILVLFVLARIFRHGAEMRADLEGTV